MPTVSVNLVVTVMIVAPVGSWADFTSSLDVFLILLTPALVNFAVLAKRWHDRNKSAWWTFILLVPVIGVLWTSVECGFFKGTLGKKPLRPRSLANPMKTQLHQIIPNEVCFACDVCCRFLDADSPLAPIFTEAERERVILHNADRVQFRPQADRKSAQIVLEASRLENALTGYICPFFDEDTSHCTIYPIRPLDCQLYPFRADVQRG